MKNAAFLRRPFQQERSSRRYDNLNKSYVLRESKDVMQRTPSNLINRSLSPQPSNPSIEWAPVDDERRDALHMLFHKRSFKSTLYERSKFPEIN